MRGRTRAGLSLVETIAVMGLISLILLFTLGLIPSFKVSNRRANMELQAGNLAQSYLEEQKARPFADLVSEPLVDLPTDGVPYQREVLVEPGPSDNSKRVRVRIQWLWKEKSYETFRETLICDIPRG